MSVTIKDIARAAGVAHPTVSRALNGSPVVNADTAQRIRRLAKKMGYVPNAVARHFQNKRTRTVGMVLTTMTDPFLARIVAGVEQVACEAGYGLFVSTSHENPNREIGVIETLYRRRVDAIIIASMWVSSVYREELERIRVPIVLINHRLEGKHLHYVTVDDVQGARLAVEHLISLGHRRIAFVRSAERPDVYVENRLVGFREAHQVAGLPVDPLLEILPEGGSDFTRGRQSLGALRKARATAAFCYNDLTAIGLLKACRQAGVRVPDDLSLVGFDDLEETEYVSPSLTTVRQPRAQLGQVAMRMALGLLEGRSDVKNEILPCELVARESTLIPVF